MTVPGPFTGLRDALRAVAGTLVTLPYEAWHFGDSVAFEGMVEASDALDDPRYASFAHGFARGWAASRETFVPLDCTAAGAVICRLAERAGDRDLLAVATGLAEYLADRRRIDGVFATWESSPLREPYGGGGLDADGRRLLAAPPAGVFLDCLHFDPPFFAALARSTGEDRWAELALDQALGYVRMLQDEASGLFHHFHLEGQPRPFALGWGRGQGWALLGLLDVVEALGAEAAGSGLGASARALAAAMVATQRPDGHWDAVVGDEASGMESSTAAFMATAFPRMLALGLVDGADAPQLVDATTRARDAVLRTLDDTGVLREVSVAVWASTSLDHYRHVPRDRTVPWGQGPAATMLATAVRAADAGSLP